MHNRNDEPSRKTLQTAEAAVKRMQSRLYTNSTSINGATHFQAESYLWKKFISLDGECRLYTTMVLICMSLALLIWFFERGLLDDRDEAGLLEIFENLGVAEKRLLRSFFLLLGAVLNGVIAFLLLGLNLRDLKTTPDSVSIRWLFLSAFGYIIGNLAAAGIVYSAHESYKWRTSRGSYEQPEPHYFILGVFVFLMWVMDILYIRQIYLPFFESRAKGWEFVRRNIPAIIELGRRQRGETTCKEKVIYWLMSLINGFIRSVNYCIYLIFHVCEEILQWWMRVSRDKNSFSILKNFSRGISFLFLLPFQFLRWSPLVQIPYWTSNCVSRLILQSIEYIFRPILRFAETSRIKGSKSQASWYYRVFRNLLILFEKFFSVFTHFKPEVQKAANELWDDIKEDEEYKHSSWLKASVTTASILLLYFGLRMINQFRGYMDDVYTPTRRCIVNNPGVSNFFLRFIGFSPSNSTIDGGVEGDQYDAVCGASLLTESDASPQDQAQTLLTNFTQTGEVPNVQNPYLEFSRQLNERVDQDLEEDRLYICERGERQENVCVLLSAVNLAEEILHGNATEKPSDEFFGSFTGEVVYVFDVYMRNLDWTVWIGLIVGLLFGFWTLLSVMGQYKRLSLAIRCGLFQDFEVGDREKLSSSTSQKKNFLSRVDSIIDTHSFAKLISQYPMSISVLFSGMLISTAILQLVVFGGLVASAVSLLASLSDSEVLSIVSPLLWMLLAFLITWLVNGPLATLVLGEGLLVSHFQVVHEILFFLFLLVFTSVHLVIGIFLAFFRMLWVLLTSLVTINRLDKNLFTIYRERDVGHKSFMALVFMQHVFHVNRSGNQHQRSLWEDVLKQVENADGRNTLRRSLQKRTTATNRNLNRTLDALMEQDGFYSEEEERAEEGRSPFRGRQRQTNQVQFAQQEESIEIAELADHRLVGDNTTNRTE